MVADCLTWGLVNIPALIPFSLSGPKAARRPGWTVVQCIWFEKPNIVPNIGIAECRWSLSSDSQYVGDPSSSPHDEPHRYGTTKSAGLGIVMWWLWGNMFVSQNGQNTTGVSFGKRSAAARARIICSCRGDSCSAVDVVTWYCRPLVKTPLWWTEADKALSNWAWLDD